MFSLREYFCDVWHHKALVLKDRQRYTTSLCNFLPDFFWITPLKLGANCWHFIVASLTLWLCQRLKVKWVDHFKLRFLQKKVSHFYSVPKLWTAPKAYLLSVYILTMIIIGYQALVSVVSCAIKADFTSEKRSYSRQQRVEHIACTSHTLCLLNRNVGLPTIIIWEIHISQQMTGLERSFLELDSRGQNKTSIGTVFIRFLISNKDLSIWKVWCVCYFYF